MEAYILGSCTFTPQAITKQWQRWLYTLRELQLLYRRAEVTVNGPIKWRKWRPYGIEVADLLERQPLPRSWYGKTFILPGTVRWARCGLFPRRFVAALRQVGDRWVAQYRTVSGGFGPNDYFLVTYPPPIGEDPISDQR